MKSSAGYIVRDSPLQVLGSVVASNYVRELARSTSARHIRTGWHNTVNMKALLMTLYAPTFEFASYAELAELVCYRTLHPTSTRLQT